MDAPKNKSPQQVSGGPGAAVRDSSGSGALQEGNRQAGAVTAAGAASAPAMAGAILQTGIIVGNRYEIQQMLGLGGMGAVYKAYDRDIERVVALKVIRPDLAGNSSIIQRFKQELILARQVTHRNVIRIYDLGEADRMKFITMEFIDGEPLTNLLQRRGKLPLQEAAHIIEQVCLALEAAHAEGVVHRDLKPANIMQDSHGRIVVMDFGLAHSMDMPILQRTDLRSMDALDQDSKATAYRSLPGTLVGTPLYMSPEQALREQTDGRSDLYTVGLILYELLTGEVPFKGEDANETLLNRVQEKAKPLAEIDPQIPKPISNLVGKCLERSRDARYQTVQELLSDLRAWLHPARKTWRWAIAAAVASVLVATQIVVQQKLAHKAGAQHPSVSVLVTDFKNDTGEAVFDGTLEPAFGVDLEGASFITGYNRAQAHKILARLRPGATVLDDQSARLVAARENINVVLSGEISRKRNNYDVQVNAIDPLSGKSLVRVDRVTDRKGVLLALGELAARVRKILGDTTPESKQLTAAENFTTQSLDAAHEYAAGQEQAVAGKWDGAMQHWQRATQLDPEMGRAYVGLGNAYFNTGQVQQAQKYYQLALSKIDRMSDREKYRTRGTYYLMMRDTDKALEQQLQLVKEYPSDNAGIFNLALAYFYRRDMGRALEVGRQALAIYPQNLLARNNVGLFAMYAGQFDAAIAEQTAVIKTNPSFALGYVGLALSELGEGRTTQAIDTYQKLSSAGAQGKSSASLGLADVALYQGRTSDAVKILEEGVESDLGAKNVDAAAVKLGILAQAYAAGGRTAAAVRAADRALTLSKQTGVMFWAARAYIAAKQPAKALRIAQQLGSGLETDPQAYAKLIEGEADLKAGKPREAIKLFLESRKLADTWMGRLDTGETYIELKAYEEAESDLDVCLKRRGEATALFLDENPNYFVFPPAYYYLARAQEGLKSPAGADSFKTFLAMKEKAEPDPLIADARHRLAKQ